MGTITVQKWKVLVGLRYNDDCGILSPLRKLSQIDVYFDNFDNKGTDKLDDFL